MKRLIINADDLGLCETVNRGIELAHREGVLTSASLMANTPGFAGGAEVARRNPALGVGVHLNALRGAALTGAAREAGLAGEDGRFRLDFSEIGKAVRDPRVLAALEAEYRAQIEKVLAAGLKPDHLDTEKHHGVWGRIAGLLRRLAGEYAIPAVRNLEEPAWLSLRRLPWPGLGAALRSCGLRLCATVCKRSGNLKTPDHFFGQYSIGRLDRSAWRALAEILPDGASEVMTHPGAEMTAEETAALEAETGPSWINASRPTELAALADPALKELLANRGVTLIRFADL